MKLRYSLNTGNELAWTVACVLLVVTCSLGCTNSQPAPPSAPSTTVETTTNTETSNADDDKQEQRVFNAQRQIENSLVIGLDADVSSGSAPGGIAIKRGAELAIEEINADGGLLGRPVELLVRDHRGNPDRGLDNIVEFAKMSDVVAVVGGLHTPVAMRELEAIHEHKMIYLSPWAAGTLIVKNGYTPNYVFRVSVRDEYAGGFLVGQAVDRGLKKIGLLLERTSWGRSNEEAMQNALQAQGLEPAVVEWFSWGETDFSAQIDRLSEGNTQCMLLVCNPLEGVVAVKSMAARPLADRLPIISHWGITGNDFAKMAQEYLSDVDLSFLQTHSFIQPRLAERSNRLVEAYKARFDDCHTAHDIFSPVGTAHAYEIVMMLNEAVKKANSIDRNLIRNALEELGSYQGIIRDYDPPFRPDHHDALDAGDFIMAHFGKNGVIEPVKNAKVKTSDQK